MGINRPADPAGSCDAKDEIKRCMEVPQLTPPSLSPRPPPFHPCILSFFLLQLCAFVIVKYHNMSIPEPRFTPVLLALPSLTPSLALEVSQRILSSMCRYSATHFFQVLPHGVTLHRLYVQADGRVFSST